MIDINLLKVNVFYLRAINNNMVEVKSTQF